MAAREQSPRAAAAAGATASAAPKDDSDAWRIAKNLIAGTAGGIGQVLAGQPFDTVKVRLQSGMHPTAGSAIRALIAKEGPLAFYKGTAVPLAGAGACVAVQFAGLSQARAMLMHRAIANGREDATVDTLTIGESCLAGAIAGSINGALSIPIEHVRIQLQVSASSSPSLGPVAVARKLIQQGGVFSRNGLYRGTAVTLLREAPGYGAYFASYDYMTRQIVPEGGSINDIPAWQLMPIGGIAGLSMWVLTYSVDSVKSALQADHIEPHLRKYTSARHAFRTMLATGGVRSLYAGFFVCCARALPANMATFGCFEVAMRAMGGR